MAKKPPASSDTPAGDVAPGEPPAPAADRPYPPDDGPRYAVAVHQPGALAGHHKDQPAGHDQLGVAVAAAAAAVQDGGLSAVVFDRKVGQIVHREPAAASEAV